MQKYSVNQHLIETILAWVNSGEIAIPVGLSGSEATFSSLQDAMSKNASCFAVASAT